MMNQIVRPSTLGRVLAYFTNAVAYAGKAFPKKGYRFDAGLASMSKQGQWETLEPEEHRKAYRLAVTSAWVYSDIRLLSDRAATAEAMPQVKKRAGEDLEDVGDHAYEQLLKTPNPLMTGKYLRRYVVWWLLLKGESYVFIGTPRWGGGEPLELWPLPSDMVRPLPQTLRKSVLTGGPTINYEYTIPGQDPIIYPGENILHYRLPNPFNYWQGMSPLTAAMLGIQTDISQGKWTRDFFGKDNAIPTALISLPKDISEDEFAIAVEAIREQFGEKRKSAVIPAGEMSVEVITQTLEQMQMIASRNFNKNEIDRVYGVPEGYMGAGLTGAAQLAHEIALARNGIQPLIDYLAAEETAKIGPYYGEDIVIAAPNVIPQDRALDMHEYRVYGLDRTINENRAEQDLDDWEDELGGIPVRVLEAMIKTGQAGGMGASVGGLPGGSMNMPQAKAYKDDLIRWRKVALKEAKGGRDPGKREFLSDEIPAELYYDIANDLLGADEEEVKAIFARPFEDAATKAAPDRAAEIKLARRIASILRNHWGLAATDIAGGETIDLAELEHLLQAEIMTELADVATNQAMLAAEGIGIGFELGEVNAAASEWARQYAFDLVKDLTDTTRKVVSNATSQFVETPGMTIGQLRGLLKPAFGDTRAQMIAVTETTRAFSQGTNIYQEMLRGAGVEMTRIWNTSADERVCPICGPLEGRPEAEWANEFPTGPPAHVNCRCFATLTTIAERATEERWEYMGEEIVQEPSWDKPTIAPEQPNLLPSRDFENAVDLRCGNNARVAKQLTMQSLAMRLEGDEDFQQLVPWLSRLGMSGETDTERATAYLINSWAVTSGDDDRLSVALQQAVQAEFNTPKWKWGEEVLSRVADAYDEADKRGFRKFVRAMYDESQAYLQSQGVESLWTYRGMAIARKAGFEKTLLDMQPISSFSTRFQGARDFAYQRGDLNAVIVGTQIPRERILGFPTTGFGCLGEYEVVVLGGRTECWARTAPLGVRSMGDEWSFREHIASWIAGT